MRGRTLTGVQRSRSESLVFIRCQQIGRPVDFTTQHNDCPLLGSQLIERT